MALAMALTMALAMALETIFPRLFKRAEKIAQPALKPFNAKSCAGNLEKNGFRTGRPDRPSAAIGVDGAQGQARGNFSICHTIKMITFKHCRIIANATNLPLLHIYECHKLAVTTYLPMLQSGQHARSM